MSKNYDYELTYSVDRDGTKETLSLGEVPYDVYKASIPFFESDVDKALLMIIKDVAETGGKEIALKHIENKNTIAIKSLEHGIGLMTNSFPATIKKKSKSTQLDLQR